MFRYRIRSLALLSSLLLHLLLLLLTRNLDFLAVDQSAFRSQVDDVVELFLVPDEAPADAARPEVYISVPQRHEAETPPDTPDYLALRDSRAADLSPDGDDMGSPQAPWASEVTQVAIGRHEPGPAADGVAMLDAPEARPAPPGAAGDGLQREEREERSETGETAEGLTQTDARDTDEGDTESADPTASPELADLPARASPSILETAPGASGDPGFDYDQDASGATEGNMVRFGEYQLNTVAWEFAPWLEQFRRDFLPNWIPPYAYMLGVIDGRTTLRLVIELSGGIGELEVVQEEGHESLHQASVAALRSAAPYAPLPEDFPEENLVIILSLHYPAWSQ